MFGEESLVLVFGQIVLEYLNARLCNEHVEHFLSVDAEHANESALSN